MIIVLVGTRPEIIKMSPVIKELQKQHLQFKLVHSNQHYSAEMDDIFFKQLDLPTPDYNLRMQPGSHAFQIASAITNFEKLCQELHPDTVLVHGDTNTTLTGALVAKKEQITLAHVEAGLRSGDLSMPEEINRIIVDSISDIHFAPSTISAENLKKEGKTDKVVITGNTIVDAIYQNKDRIKNSKPTAFNLPDQGFGLVTAHRPVNVDTRENLQKLLSLLQEASNKIKKQLIWPIHPRTKAKLDEFGLTIDSSILLIEPVGYFEMLFLISKATCVLTDSGGIQEEAYVFHRPLITLRENTERPETLTANFLVGLDSIKLERALEAYEKLELNWTDALGDGKASIKIVNTLRDYQKT